MTAPLAALRFVPPPHRAILHLKALIGAETGKTVFMDCLNRLRLTTPAWSNKTLTPVLDGLRSKGLLNDDLACMPEIAHPLAVEALASPEGAAMIDAIRATLPQEDRRVWDWRVMEVNTLRWQRLAVLLNDEDAYGQATDLHRKRTYRTAPSVFDQHFVNVAVGAEWLASRTRAFQSAILQAKAGRWIGTGTATSDYAELMDLCRRDAGLRNAAFPMVADFDILSGSLSHLAETIAAAPGDIQADMPVAFAAVHALLSGDVVPSVRLFSDALKLHRKVTRKRKGGLPGYMGLLHLCSPAGRRRCRAAS